MRTGDYYRSTHPLYSCSEFPKGSHVESYVIVGSLSSTGTGDCAGPKGISLSSLEKGGIIGSVSAL